MADPTATPTPAVPGQAGTAVPPSPLVNDIPAAAPPAVDPDIEAQNSALQKLSTDELIGIIRETRSEAKTRRLKAKELEGKITDIEKQKLLDEAVSLEKNQEFEKLYNGIKENTKDYDELKTFKQTFLESCEKEVEELKKGLTIAEVELFDLSSKSQSFDNQVKIIKKIIENKNSTSPIDPVQSTYRNTGKAYTKEELLADTKLMAEVKEKNPALYDKYFGKFK